MASWSPTSWEGRPIQQQPSWDARVATSHIATLPPLVHPCEIQALKQELQAVMRGERFLLQGGDCAERFLDCNATALESKLRILLQMSLVLQQRANVPTVRVARIAGTCQVGAALHHSPWICKVPDCVVCYTRARCRSICQTAVQGY